MPLRGQFGSYQNYSFVISSDNTADVNNRSEVIRNVFIPLSLSFFVLFVFFG